jgi:hypothetical protein
MKQEKPVSTFLRFQLKSGKKVTEEPEKPKTVERLPVTVAHICCPVCGMHTVLRRTGWWSRSGKKRSKNSVFGIHLEDAPFVSIRVAPGRAGFIEKATIKLKDIARLPERDKKILLPIMEQLKSQCSKVIKTVEKII